MAATEQNRETSDGLELDEVASNISGTRRITHEIDTDYGTGRKASALHPRVSLESLEQRPSHVPTLRAPTLEAPSSRPARTKPTSRKAIGPWDFQASSEVSFFGSHVEGLLESLSDAPVVTESPLCTEDLVAVAVEALGGLRRVPRVAVRPRALASLRLDQREAFVLSLVDGVATIEDIVDMSALPEVDALRVLVELCRRELVRCS